MNTYTPDNWVVIEVKTTGGFLYKILSGWRGGYVGADEWRVSSGIVDVVDKNDHYEVLNQSGSVYRCYKNREGLRTLTASILNKLNEDKTFPVVEVVEISKCKEKKNQQDKIVKGEKYTPSQN